MGARRRGIDVQEAVGNADEEVGVARVRQVLDQVSQQRQQPLRVPPTCSHTTPSTIKAAFFSTLAWPIDL